MLYKLYKILPIKLRWLISYFYADKFLIGVVAFVRRDNQILFLKHKYQYPWALPGGFLKKGESIHEAVIREIQEETGLNIKVNKILDIKNGATKPILDIMIECEVTGGSIRADGKEIELAQFFDCTKLPERILCTHEPLVLEYLSLSKPER